MVAGALEQVFRWPVRVYYEDTDAAGIVYHSNYLRFMERARTEWLRALGFEQDRLREQEHVIFVITHSDVHYRQIARFNEELLVTSRLERLRRASMTFEQIIQNKADETVCLAHNTVACVNASAFTPTRVPAHIMRIFDGAN